MGISRGGFREDLRHSYYLCHLRDALPLLVAALLLGIFLSMIADPGIWYSDSYSRVEFSKQIKARILVLLTDPQSLRPTSYWLTVFPSLVMAICTYLTGNILSYTVLQAVMFYFALFSLIKRLTPTLSMRIFVYALYAICPLIYGAAVYYEAGVGCLTGIIYLALILLTNTRTENRFDIALETIAIALCSLVIFGYRANALTICPVIAFYVLRDYKGWATRVRIILAVLMGLIMAAGIPKMLRIDTMDSGAAGLVWEILLGIDEVDADERPTSEALIDGLFGDGVAREASKAVSPDRIGGYSDAGIDGTTISSVGTRRIVLDAYIPFAIRQPFAFLKVKWHMIARTMGIGRPLGHPEYDYNRWDRMEGYGFSDTRQRHEFVNSWHDFCESTPFLRMPWLMFLITFVLIGLYRHDGEAARSYLLLAMLALFYYGSFLITTQAFEIRYFYPSLILLLTCDLSILARLVDSRLVGRVRKVRVRAES